jgi:hypothetical protein
MIAYERGALGSWVSSFITNISKRQFLSVCLVTMAVQSVIYYLFLLEPFIKTFSYKSEKRQEVVEIAMRRDALIRRLEMIEGDLLSLKSEERNNVDSRVGDARGQLLATLDRAASVAAVKLGHLSSTSSSTSSLALSGSYQAITDFIAELSYDGSSEVVMTVLLNAPRDWSYPSKGIIEAQIDLRSETKPIPAEKADLELPYK